MCLVWIILSCWFSIIHSTRTFTFLEMKQFNDHCQRLRNKPTQIITDFKAQFMDPYFTAKSLPNLYPLGCVLRACATTKNFKDAELIFKFVQNPSNSDMQPNHLHYSSLLHVFYESMSYITEEYLMHTARYYVNEYISLFKTVPTVLELGIRETQFKPVMIFHQLMKMVIKSHTPFAYKKQYIAHLGKEMEELNITPDTENRLLLEADTPEKLQAAFKATSVGRFNRVRNTVNKVLDSEKENNVEGNSGIPMLESRNPFHNLKRYISQQNEIAGNDAEEVLQTNKRNRAPFTNIQNA